MLGLTFKENRAYLRNSKVADVIDALKSNGLPQAADIDRQMIFRKNGSRAVTLSMPKRVLIGPVWSRPAFGFGAFDFGRAGAGNIGSHNEDRHPFRNMSENSVIDFLHIACSLQTRHAALYVIFNFLFSNSPLSIPTNCAGDFFPLL